MSIESINEKINSLNISEKLRNFIIATGSIEESEFVVKSIMNNWNNVIYNFTSSDKFTAIIDENSSEPRYSYVFTVDTKLNTVQYGTTLDKYKTFHLKYNSKIVQKLIENAKEHKLASIINEIAHLFE